MAIKAASAIMRWSNLVGLGGAGAEFGSTPEQLCASDPAIRFRQAFYERDHIDEFYRFFPDLDLVLAGKDVLDFGCGYGGKTVEFARRARSAAGVEPFANQIELATQYARHLGSGNLVFRQCSQHTIPFEDCSFDVVVSHDVLEHVENPEISLREIHRVLRPGGVALLAFPPYEGMLAHHLDYVSKLPGQHWFFSPDTLVAAANIEIKRRRLPMSTQPSPALSWDGSRKVIPTLNGLTNAQFERLAKIFDHAEIGKSVASSRHRGLPGLMLKMLVKILPSEKGTGAIVARLHKVRNLEPALSGPKL